MVRLEAAWANAAELRSTKASQQRKLRFFQAR